MAGFLKSPSFGLNIHTMIRPGIDPLAETIQAEKLGFDVVTLHRDVLNGDDPSFEMWTLLSWLAARTTRIILAPVVLALPNRHPAVLSKMAEALDRLSGGRLILALGAGGPMNDPNIRAFGLAQRSPQEKVVALEEVVDIIRGLWSASGFSYQGKYFNTQDATINPKPDHAIPIWLGVFGDRMVDLVGRKADGWIPSLPLLEPEQAYRKWQRIRIAAEKAGRNPDRITFAYNIPVLVEPGATSRQGLIAGSASQVASQLASFVDHGVTFLNFWPAVDAASQRQKLAEEVIPAVRDRIAYSTQGES